MSLPLLLRLLIATLVIASFIVLTQNIQIFPGAVLSINESTERDPNTLPKGVNGYFVTTKDREKLEVWKLPVAESEYVAVIFHGNGGNIENFFIYQKYMYDQGITSYGFDYRGYGKSTGWPSERGLYLDAEAVVDRVLESDGVDSSKLILVGVSIGSGPAAYAAAKYKPKALILFSPFQSLPAAVSTVPLFGFLHPFTFYEFPVEKNVASLEETCLIVAHGVQDEVIPVEQGKAVFNAYRGSGFSELVIAPKAKHNDIILKVQPQLAKVMPGCLPG